MRFAVRSTDKEKAHFKKIKWFAVCSTDEEKALLKNKSSWPCAPLMKNKHPTK